jgi:hypothetical protein
VRTEAPMVDHGRASRALMRHVLVAALSASRMALSTNRRAPKPNELRYEDEACRHLAKGWRVLAQLDPLTGGAA